jgi:hypothetical protein
VHGLQGVELWGGDEHHVGHELCRLQHLQRLRRSGLGTSLNQVHRRHVDFHTNQTLLVIGMF